MYTQTSRHVSQWLCKYTFSITRGQWYIYDNLLLLWQTIKSRRRQETSALHRTEDTTHTTHHNDDVFIRADGRNPSNCAARATLVGNICYHIHRVVAYHWWKENHSYGNTCEHETIGQHRWAIHWAIPAITDTVNFGKLSWNHWSLCRKRSSLRISWLINWLAFCKQIWR